MLAAEQAEHPVADDFWPFPRCDHQFQPEQALVMQLCLCLDRSNVQCHGPILLLLPHS